MLRVGDHPVPGPVGGQVAQVVQRPRERPVAVGRMLPWTPGFAPLAAGDMSAARRSDHHLINGLGTSDFAWLRNGKATAPLGGPAIIPPSEGAAVTLTEPALLVAVPLGKGVILIHRSTFIFFILSRVIFCSAMIAMLPWTAHIPMTWASHE